MAEVGELLDLLLQDESEDAAAAESDDAEAFAKAPEQEGTETSGLNLGELFSLLDTYQEVIGEIKNDDRAQLIKAIRPFLSESRQVKADHCLKFLSVTRFMEHKDALAKIGGKILPV